VSASGADALLPVLAARDESVRDKVDAHFSGSSTVWWDDTLCVNTRGSVSPDGYQLAPRTLRVRPSGLKAVACR